ncbi:hypothetical protein D0Z07_0588 [Hyphodiscus hymeniophilus]|uniref:Uncharacterized protein n=1 Tax=Hyphodiscus hymeniophilus TaxID=353542 RepID=A0A9P7B111_9HELO|nr:hypothetical protein D0Z07_0588 [Hyphodiscus hymeniophilus]
MSAPANTASEEREKSGVGRLLSRMKTVLRRSNGSKRLSVSGKSPVATATPSTAGPSTSKHPDPVPGVEPTEPNTAPDGPQPVRMMRSQIDAERADRLGQRFKLPKMDAYEFPSRPDREALRIEKPIRMRIHRTCHKCQTTFGGNKICASCEHPRCSQCPRYPAKKAKTAGGTGKENEAAKTMIEGHIEPDTYWGMGEKAKKKSYPYGYPGDAYSTTSLLPLNYSCHQCTKVFPGIPHPNSPEGLAATADPPPPPKCVRCGHEKCSECPRAPIVKVEPAPDPEILRRVEAKLAAMNVGESVEGVDT